MTRTTPLVVSSRVLCIISVACGCVATTSCRGLLGALDGEDRDTVGDLLILGLDNSRNGMLVDVSLTHPISGKGKTKKQAAQITGHAGQQVLATKANRYKDLPEKSGFEFTAFVMKTSGGRTQPVIDLLKRLARHYADNIDPMRLSARDTPHALACRRYIQWLQAHSIARARTIADRLRGASAHTAAHIVPFCSSTSPSNSVSGLVARLWYRSPSGQSEQSKATISTDRISEDPTGSRSLSK